METLEYCVLQIGVGHLYLVRIERCAFALKGARDSFEQCANLIVEAYRGARNGSRQI